MITPKPPNFLAAHESGFRYLEKSTPRNTGLEFLTCGLYELAGPPSGLLAHPGEETLLFCWQGAVTVEVLGGKHSLAAYDVLYVPRGAAYRLESAAASTKIVVCRAPAERSHPVFHGPWQSFSQDERRIRHLKGKDVFLMFDVSEAADKLMAGYTIFRPFQRSYPPHNHTDQEEIYFFLKGHGAMEVYPDEEAKCFVRSVQAGDAVTIPVLNYHPVFSQEEELHFLWCIAGNRYWVGDKHKDFLTGKIEKLTT